MGKSEDTLKSLLEKAKTISSPFKRKLYVVALLTEALKPYDIRPIVVGGAAVEFYTLGNYATLDVDLVSGGYERIDHILRGWGFTKRGRYWENVELDIAIEVPDSELAGSYDKIIEVEIEGMSLYVIGVEDLIIDRLNAFVYWRSERDGEWAKQLMALHEGRIDWRYLEERARAEGVIEALNHLRREID